MCAHQCCEWKGYLNNIYVVNGKGDLIIIAMGLSTVVHTIIIIMSKNYDWAGFGEICNI